MNTILFLPLSLFFIIAALITLLPDLRRCDLRRRDNGRVTAGEVCVLALICAVYAAVAFFRLGNTVSPESFASFKEGESVTIELPGEEHVASMSLFSGLNVGEFSIEFSVDGQEYFHASDFDQNYVSIFKWNSISPDSSSLSAPARYVRISCTGGEPYLGEVAFFAEGRRLITPVGGGALTDEQSTAPVESTFMDSSYFDEIYHARTAAEHIANIKPYEISHPPLGKLIIALGIRLFGLTPFGWRFSGTLFGVLMLPALYFFCRSMFEKRVAACCTVIFAFDFMHFVQTRLATIDTYAVFFIILMYWFMYLYVTQDKDGGEKRARTYLALSGVFFGLGAASKWTALYAGAGLAVIWLAHWIIKLASSKKSADARRRVRNGFFRNCGFCTVFFVVIPALIYYLSYFRYGTAAGLRAPGMFFTKEYLDIVLDNQRFMFTYHVGIKATHPYASRWYQWVFDIKPILYFLHYGKDGIQQSFGAFVNPALCWGGIISVVILCAVAIIRRDRTAAFICAGYFAQLVPWMFIDRLTFEYHYFPCTVFLVLALGYIFELIARSERRWRLPVYGYTAVCTALFALFYPVLSGAPVYGLVVEKLLGWFPTWPF